MRILHLAAGAGTMYCGACARDMVMAKGLLKLGHDFEILPLYTPLKIDGEAPTAPGPVFLGGLLPSPLAFLQVGLPGRAPEAFNDDIGFLVRRGADPLAKCDAGATQHVPQTIQLIVGQGVHRVHQDRRQTGCDALVPLP